MTTQDKDQFQETVEMSQSANLLLPISKLVEKADAFDAIMHELNNESVYFNRSIREAIDKANAFEWIEKIYGTAYDMKILFMESGHGFFEWTIEFRNEYYGKEYSYSIGYRPLLELIQKVIKDQKEIKDMEIKKEEKDVREAVQNAMKDEK